MHYPNFMPPDPEWAQEPEELDDEGPSISIMYIADEDVWQAVWGDRQQLGEFEGTREEAIAWARERCETIRIYSLTERDIVDLGPDEQ
jgi:hypothetical protein